MVIAHFCTAVRAAVREWMGAQSEPQIREALENPVALGAQLLPVIQAKLSAAGATTLAEVLEHAWTAPALHLRSVFEPGALPPTPEGFTPVPVCPGTAVAMVTAIAALAALNSATISYGSENDGHLFVNLVVIPEKGTYRRNRREECKDTPMVCRSHCVATEILMMPVLRHRPTLSGSAAYEILRVYRPR